MSIPVTIGANHGATILHRSSTGLTPGRTGGLHRARFKDVPGMCRYRPDGIPMVTRLLSSSSRLTTVFDSLHGKHFKTTGDMSQFNTVNPRSPRLYTHCPSSGTCTTFISHGFNPGYSIILMQSGTYATHTVLRLRGLLRN